MDQCGRIRLILKENGLKQRQLAAGLGVTESYISKLLRDPGIRLSPSLAALVEERYGYRAQWLLTGQGPKLRQARGQPGDLSELHQRALARLGGCGPLWPPWWWWGGAWRTGRSRPTPNKKAKKRPSAAPTGW